MGDNESAPRLQAMGSTEREPRELLGQLANLPVVIARHRKDLLAANLLADGVTPFTLALIQRAANFEFSARGVVNGLAWRVHHLALPMTSRNASIKFSFSGRRTALLGGLITSIGLALPICIRVPGFRTCPAR